MKGIHGHLFGAVVALFAVLPSTVLAQNPDIVVTITESDDPVYAGVGVPGNLTYIVEAENAGDADATDVELSVNLTLPPGVTVHSVTPFNGTWSNSFPGTLDIVALVAPGELGSSNSTLTIDLTVSGTAGAATDAISITANVSALNETDSDTNNDFANEATSITTIATFGVTKDFSDDSTAGVEVQLTCSGGQVLGPLPIITEGPLYGLTVVDFPAGTSCTVTETVPAGYSASYAAGCTIDPIVSNLGTYPCLITNTQLPVQIVVNKSFTDGNDADVTIDLVCGAGTVTADDPTASGSDPAEFTISDLPATGTTCTATETLPAGYGQESTTCTDVAVAVGGSPSCEFVNAPSQARIWVSKVFTDGNPGEIEVALRCNTGLPLEQTFDISPGHPVAFVVTNYNDGELDCTVTEDGEAGYIGSYYDGTTVTDTACEFLDIAAIAELSCEITNTPAPVNLDITKEWVIEGAASDISTGYELIVYCDAEIVDGDQSCLNGVPEGNTPNGEPVPISNWCKQITDEGPNLHTVQVIPGYPSSSCWVDEVLYDDAVEVDNGCGSLTVSAGVGAACTITNTVFFESIPTLNGYGRILMILLLLGVGLVAYRRIV
jgi:uncharacterized repeat protein (TIGR01451 family)